MKVKKCLPMIAVLSAMILLPMNINARTSISDLQLSDGVVLIDQDRAMAGNVTPGDAPGFPVTLSQSGSYRLVGNLKVPDANTTGIEVRAVNVGMNLNVSIDLNGFTIEGHTSCDFDGNFPGPATCTNTGTGKGVESLGGETDVIVKNGTIKGMGEVGIHLGTNGKVYDVVAVENGKVGIVVGSGLGGTVNNCSATANGWQGIFSSGNVTNSIAVANGRDGIKIFNQGGTVVGNTSKHNGGFGLLLSTGTAYAHNSMVNNDSGNVSGGIQTAGNVCGTVLCP